MKVRRALALLALSMALLACGGEEVPPPDVYTSRGLVRQLPTPGSQPDVYIHHEAIETFKDKDGQVIGMESMVMPFTVPDGTELGDVEVGDKVAVTFAVHWHEGAPLRVRDVEVLAPSVVLDFEVTSAEGDPAQDDETSGDAAQDDASHDHDGMQGAHAHGEGAQLDEPTDDSPAATGDVNTP